MERLIAAIVALLGVWTKPSGEVVLVEHARRAGGMAYVRELAEGTLEASRVHSIEPFSLLALAHLESGLNRYAVQPRTKAWGLLGLAERSRWGIRARRECKTNPDECTASQLLRGAEAYRYALDACDGTELAAISFHRFGDCRKARARERLVLALRDRLVARHGEERRTEDL